MSKGLHALRKLANRERAEAGLPPDNSPVEGSALARKARSYPQGCSRPVAVLNCVPMGLFRACPNCKANNYSSRLKCRRCGERM